MNDGPLFRPAKNGQFFISTWWRKACRRLLSLLLSHLWFSGVIVSAQLRTTLALAGNVRDKEVTRISLWRGSWCIVISLRWVAEEWATPTNATTNVNDLSLFLIGGTYILLSVVHSSERRNAINYQQCCQHWWAAMTAAAIITTPPIIIRHSCCLPASSSWHCI